MASPNHSSQAIVATLLPSNEILELLTVSFPSQSATHTFAVKMFLSDNEDLPMRLWLESNDTKHQWECLVLDTQNHVPKGAKYVLPWDSVVSSLKSGLEHLASHATCECDYVVTLEDGDSGHLRLALVLPYARSYYATYSFDLVPMAIEKVDIVHAQLRDVQAQLRVVQAQLYDTLMVKQLDRIPANVADDKFLVGDVEAPLRVLQDAAAIENSSSINAQFRHSQAQFDDIKSELSTIKTQLRDTQDSIAAQHADKAQAHNFDTVHHLGDDVQAQLSAIRDELGDFKAVQDAVAIKNANNAQALFHGLQTEIRDVQAQLASGKASQDTFAIENASSVQAQLLGFQAQLRDIKTLFRNSQDTAGIEYARFQAQFIDIQAQVFAVHAQHREMVDIVQTQLGNVQAQLRDVTPLIETVKWDSVRAQLCDFKAQLFDFSAQLRDVQDAAAIPSAVPAIAPIYVSWTSAESASPSMFLKWIAAPTNIFEYQTSADCTTIRLAKRGLYYVEAHGVIDAVSQGSGMRLVVDGVNIHTSPLDHNIRRSNPVVRISHMLIASKQLRLRFQCFGTYNIDQGATLTVVLMNEFA
ncbi:Aste57867_4633 [Aphanomyces stellatus]|uniref:Aste57867_4633 protein n=1 Tax=Aphanomyces stellatus TaxID=120398 RepID=A0A485KGX6_9STRA|nr:hypothetical protein As57867_004620 [Aphanomyces stellatus]VFT81737.1 Aste57867_4633 [Aphanomyces stellatus]